MVLVLCCPFQGKIIVRSIQTPIFLPITQILSFCVCLATFLMSFDLHQLSESPLDEAFFLHHCHHMTTIITIIMTTPIIRIFNNCTFNESH